MLFKINHLFLIYRFDFNVYPLLILVLYGFKKKPTLNEIINGIETEHVPSSCPNRTATCVRHSFELTQVAGKRMRGVEEQQARQMEEAATRHVITNVAKIRQIEHADLGAQAKTVTKHARVQAMLKQTSTENKNTSHG